jgi:hypothetical protein
MSEESQPGRTTGVWLESVIRSQNAPNDVFIDGDAERPSNLLGNARAAPEGIALLGGDNRINEFFGRALSRSSSRNRRMQRFLMSPSAQVSLLEPRCSENAM